MRRPAPKPPSALRPLQRKEGAASERQPMPGVRLAAAAAAWIGLSLAAGVATMIIGSEAALGLATNTPAVIIVTVIIVTEVYVLLIVSLLAASGRRSATLLLDAKFIPGHSVHDAVLPLRTERNRSSVPWAGTRTASDHRRN
jgi:hypothetical protein